MGYFDNLAAGNDKKQILEQDKVTKELLPGAKEAFYNETNSDAYKADLDRRIAEISSRTAPTVGKTAFGANAYGKASQLGPAHGVAAQTIARPDADARVGQGASMDAFLSGAAGKGPSVAPQQMQQSTDAALAAMSRARGARGARVNPALAGIAGRNEMGGVLHEGMLTAASSKAREANEAASRFGQLSAAVRDQDISAATAQAKMQQEAALYSANAQNANTLANKGFADQMSQFNAGAALKQAKLGQEVEFANVEADLRARGMNDQQIAGYLNNLQQQQHNDKNARQAYWEYDQDLRMFNDKAFAQGNRDRADAEAKLAASTAQVATMGMRSDERSKKNVKPGSDAVAGWLDELKPYQYEYKDPHADGAAPGKHVSVMAQDLERTSLGKSAVIEGADGMKQVDYGRLGGLSLAAIVDMHNRLKAVEKKRK